MFIVPAGPSDGAVPLNPIMLHLLAYAEPTTLTWVFALSLILAVAMVRFLQASPPPFLLYSRFSPLFSSILF